MKCKNCGSERIHKNGTSRGSQQYKCSDCGSTKKPITDNEPDSIPTKKIGISVDEFRKRHDVQYILSQVFDKLDDGVFYEKSDILQLSGLRPGYPGLSTVLESSDFKKFSGRAGGSTYYGRASLIERMKNEGILN